MKHIKKISALLLALVMVLAMSTTAFAETTTQHGTETSNTSFTIAKDIVLFNTDGSAIYEPNVTYNYAITAGAPGTATITDDPAVSTYDGNTDKSVTVQVKAGTGGVTLTGTDNVAKGVGEGNINVVFGDGDHDTPASYAYATNTEGATVSASSSKATRNITVTIDPTSSAFQQTVDGVTNYVPGVYRYHIAETANTANANGVKTPDGRLTDLTLDVYLRWNSGKTALEVYGYVLFRGLTENESLSYDGSTATTAKITGFDIASNLKSDAAGDVTSTADEYHTFNVTVSKTVDGNLADKNNAWPFSIDLTGISTTEFYYTRTGVGSGRDIAVANGLQTMGSGVNIAQTLKSGESITITGLPYNATVKATENNNTPDFYNPSATHKAGSATAVDITSELTISNNFVPASTNNTAMTAVYNNGKATTEKTLTDVLTTDIIAFTNTLTEISPTGYVVRIAPYVLMMAGGVALLIVTRRRREDAQAA